MIFFDQFKVPTIKFGKCFAESMIPIALQFRWIDLVDHEECDQDKYFSFPGMTSAV